MAYRKWKEHVSGSPSSDSNPVGLHYRQENWDSTLLLYYDAFNETLRAMSVEGVDVAYEEFLLDVKASIPISLFFCGNIQGPLDSVASLNFEWLQDRVVLLCSWWWSSF